MNLQKACEVLEELSEKEVKESKLNTIEFLALQKVLLELHIKGYYKIPEKYVETL